MHPELIKAHIRMKGINPIDLARQLGVSHTCVSHVVNGTGTSARVAQRISEVTGIAVDVLWPGQKPLRGRPVKSRAASATV